jgi:hypothetical protein
MKRILFLILFSGAIAAMAQEVDLVRLAYTKSDITSEQTGMAASADGKYLAFVFKDKTIKIFDVDAARFIKRFTGPSAMYLIYNLRMMENWLCCRVQRLLFWIGNQKSFSKIFHHRYNHQVILPGILKSFGSRPTRRVGDHL